MAQSKWDSVNQLIVAACKNIQEVGSGKVIITVEIYKFSSLYTSYDHHFSIQLCLTNLSKQFKYGTIHSSALLQAKTHQKINQ